MIDKLTLILFLVFSSQFAHSQYGDCVKGDCVNGYGQFEWITGEEYVGNFKNGKMNGYGIFYWQNKRKFVGNWKKGKMNGEGLLFYENGHIKKGIWKNNNFVRLCREDFALTKDNLEHGEIQLEQIIKDRPLMASIVKKGDLIWQWVVYKLAGEDVQSRIYWQKESTPNFPIPSGVNAVHAYPTAKSEGRIWVKNSSTPEEMWAGLIYELHNITNGKAFQSIEKDAKYWLCSKQEYVMRYARLEYRSAEDTKSFFKNIWLPYCESKSFSPTPQLWFYYLPDSFEQWQESFTDANSYPWHPYSDYYDKIVKRVVKDY